MSNRTKRFFSATAIILLFSTGPGSVSANGSASFVSFQPGQRPIRGKFTVYDMPGSSAAPYGLAADQQGRIWFTEPGANRVGVFDPQRREFAEYMVPTPEAEPQGITVDAEGIVWFTQAAKDRIGRLDPKTGVIRDFPVPAGGTRPGARGGVGRIHTPMMGKDGFLYSSNEWLSSIVKLDPKSGQTWEYMTQTKASRPYGIQIDLDGDVWFAAAAGDYVGKLTAKTGIITEYRTSTPKSGPRRLTIDPQGLIWYAEWDAHKIGYIDPKTLEQKEFAPLSHPKSGVYAVAADGAGVIYVAELISNQVSRYEPKKREWTEWPMPLANSQARGIIVDPSGYVWYADSGNSKLVRVE
jgi:virginiamycin B lyase